jgi:hypothetical protein
LRPKQFENYRKLKYRTGKIKKGKGVSRHNKIHEGRGGEIRELYVTVLEVDPREHDHKNAKSCAPLPPQTTTH